MTRTSLHKQQCKNELKEANIKIKLHKYNFSPEFADKLYKFSEEHHAEYFKTFNTKFDIWMAENKDEIDAEIRKLKDAGSGSNEEIKHKIKISARFYYRKKSKKQQNKQDKQTQKQKKPYIGLSYPFIERMDEYIKDNLLDTHSKPTFAQFTQINLEYIKDELVILKQEYDEKEVEYVPREMSIKLKKAFENRYYVLVER